MTLPSFFLHTPFDSICRFGHDAACKLLPRSSMLSFQSASLNEPTTPTTTLLPWYAPFHSLKTSQLMLVCCASVFRCGHSRCLYPCVLVHIYNTSSLFGLWNSDDDACRFFHIVLLLQIDGDGSILGFYRKSHIPDGPGTLLPLIPSHKRLPCGNVKLPLWQLPH